MCVRPGDEAVDDAVLHGDLECHRDVVERLGHAGHVQLLHARTCCNNGPAQCMHAGSRGAPFSEVFVCIGLHVIVLVVATNAWPEGQRRTQFPDKICKREAEAREARGCDRVELAKGLNDPHLAR